MIDKNKLIHAMGIAMSRAHTGDLLQQAEVALIALCKELPRPAPYYGSDPKKLQEQKDEYAMIGFKLIEIGKEG